MTAHDFTPGSVNRSAPAADLEGVPNDDHDLLQLFSAVAFPHSLRRENADDLFTITEIPELRLQVVSMNDHNTVVSHSEVLGVDSRRHVNRKSSAALRYGCG